MTSSAISRAKRCLRHVAIGLCRRVLAATSQPSTLTEGSTVIIAPHQDDETLGCGGLIARRRNEGLPVHVIFITDGSASHPGHPRLAPPEIARLRRAEALRALSLLGVERSAVHFLDEPDGTLKSVAAQRRANLVTRLGSCLATIGPAELFMPCHPDGSSEHDAAFGFVMEALARAGLRPAIWQYPIWSWWNPTLLLGHWLNSRGCHRLPLEDFRQHKEGAVHAYQTQVAPLPPDSAAALPPELVNISRADAEYFFRRPWPPTP